MLTMPEMGRDVINKFDCIQSLSTELYGFSNQWTQITKYLEVCKRRISFFGSESIWIDHQSAQMSDLLSESLSVLESIKVELEMYKSRFRNSNCCCRIFNTNLDCTTKLPDFALEKRLFRLDDVPFKTFNSRYVHLSAAESDIVGALNNTQFSTIILYGSRGSGKSTIAIYMALQYLDRANNRSLQSPKPLTRSLSGDLSPLFERVFFLKCGLNVDAVSKYQEFRQLYGPNNSEDENALVVLDDVCDDDFLQDLMGRCDASHRKVRYLVTSVEGTPKITNSKSIEIRVLQTEALSILASHIGFPENVIPDNLQDMADRVIKLVDASPLELVRFASEVRIEQTDVAVWRKAELKLRTERYSEFSTEQLSMMSLSTAAQNLLVLISTCSETPIPEDILQVMYASRILPWDSRKFSEARSELETKKWITVKSQSCEWNSEVPTMKRHMLSIRPLHSKLVRDVMKEEVEMLTCAIFGEVSAEGYESSFMMILGAFYLRRPSYFDGICAERVSKMGIDMQNLEMERRSAIEPLLWLIIAPKSQCNEEDGCDWDETSCFAARKVILGYVCKNLVKDNLVSELLRRSYSRKATCWALSLMLGRVDRRPIIDREKKPSDTMKALVDFLVENKHCLHLTQDLKERLYELELVISSNLYDQDDSRSNPIPIVLLLLGFMKDNPSSYIEAKTAVVLVVTEFLNFFRGEQENGIILSTVPEALGVLVHSVYPIGSPIFNQFEDVQSLVNTPGEYQNKRKLPLEMKDIADYFLEFLHARTAQPLDVAAQVLSILSTLFNQEFLEKISPSKHPKAFLRLVQFLREDDLPHARVLSAKLMADLASDEENRRPIIHHRDAMKSLVGLLDEDNSYSLQLQAAGTLAHLCQHKLIANTVSSSKAPFQNALSKVQELQDPSDSDVNMESMKAVLRDFRLQLIPLLTETEEPPGSSRFPSPNPLHHMFSRPHESFLRKEGLMDDTE